MSQNPFFSIIIPIYNAESFVESCLNSIIKQTFTSYEVIIINDGSKDKSLVECEKKAIGNNKIRIINQNNKGVSSARNVGINNAIGKYIVFIDIDDTLETNALEVSYNYIKKTKADTLIWNFNEWEGVLLKKSHCLILTDKTYISSNLLFKDKVRHFACWGYVLKKDIIKNLQIRFKEELSMSEDRLFIFEYLTYAKRIHTIPDSLYNHYNNPSSACNSNLNIKKAIDQLKAAEYLIRLNSSIKRKYINEIIIDCINNFLFIIKMGNITKIDDFQKAQKYLRHIILLFPMSLIIKPSILFWGYFLTSYKIKK